jgi:hypothetical protein
MLSSAYDLETWDLRKKELNPDSAVIILPSAISFPFIFGIRKCKVISHSTKQEEEGRD